MSLIHEARLLSGSAIPDDAIPLCWYAEHAIQGVDDEGWLISLDSEAIYEATSKHDLTPGSFRLRRQDEVIDCPECIAQRHA